MSKYKLKRLLLKEEVNPERNELILYHLTGIDIFRKYSEKHTVKKNRYTRLLSMI